MLFSATARIPTSGSGWNVCDPKRCRIIRRLCRALQCRAALAAKPEFVAEGFDENKIRSWVGKRRIALGVQGEKKEGAGTGAGVGAAQLKAAQARVFISDPTEVRA